MDKAMFNQLDIQPALLDCETHIFLRYKGTEGSPRSSNSLQVNLETTSNDVLRCWVRR